MGNCGSTIDYKNMNDTRIVILENHEPINVLVTGGCGFIASNFINRIVSKRWKSVETFINLDKIDKCSNEFNIDGDVRRDSRYHLVVGDYGDTELVAKLLSDHHIDTIVHFAAQSHVDVSYANPIATIENNVINFTRFLQTVTAYGKIRKFVHISTDEVYGDSSLASSAVGKRESDVMDPTNPYAASKAAGECFVHAWRHSFGLKSVMVRMNNVYGPNQDLTKVVPKFIKQRVSGSALTIHGSGSQLRSWLHVYDACEAISRVSLHGRVGELYNIGSQYEHNIKQLATMIDWIVAQLNGEAVNIENKQVKTAGVQDRPYNDQRYYIDSNKIMTHLGWTAEIPFEAGLRQTIQWYMDEWAKEKRMSLKIKENEKMRS